MTNLSAIQKKYKGMWVFVRGDFSSVITASHDAKTAYKKAQEKDTRNLQFLIAHEKKLTKLW